MRQAAGLNLCEVTMINLSCHALTRLPATTARAGQAEKADGLDVDFAGCREGATVGLAPTANLRPLVPAQFRLAAEASARTPFVVRRVHCDSITIGGMTRAGDLVQIGAVIAAPDGDGDINNYTLFYDTSDHRLA